MTDEQKEALKNLWSNVYASFGGENYRPDFCTNANDIQIPVKFLDVLNRIIQYKGLGVNTHLDVLYIKKVSPLFLSLSLCLSHFIFPLLFRFVVLEGYLQRVWISTYKNRVEASL